MEDGLSGVSAEHRAGWGYMLLTNFLPERRQRDVHPAGLCRRTRERPRSPAREQDDHLRQRHAVLPFGAIDTPAQGGTASGIGYVNFGWALTPQPNSIPTDGSTIMVWVDGVPLGHPVYNHLPGGHRDPVPGVCEFQRRRRGTITLNTTGYADGVHTIAWSVKDSAGNEDGIGSRYFSIQNIAGGESLKEATVSDICATEEEIRGLYISPPAEKTCGHLFT